MPNHKQALGRRGEQLAAAFLQRRGMEILERNFRIRGGEIDLIAKEKDTYVFVEVKARTTFRYGRGTEAVHLGKQQALLRTAQAYLYRKGLLEAPVRFDVIELDFSEEIPRLRYLKNVLFETQPI